MTYTVIHVLSADKISETQNRMRKEGWKITSYTIHQDSSVSILFKKPDNTGGIKAWG